MKKGAVDIAIMIGAIVIPTAALIGSLILAFSMIERLTDAMLVATVVAHDIAALSAVAYSMPEDVTLFHNPPFDCRYMYDYDNHYWYLTCLSDQMNISNIHRGIFTKGTRTFRHANDPVNYYAQTNFRIDIPVVGIVVRNFPYSTYTTLKENTIIYEFDEDLERLKIEKERTTFQDMLITSGVYDEYTEPVLEIVRDIHRACSTAEDIETKTLRLPPTYYICNPSAYNNIQLKKFILPPDQVTSQYRKDGIAPSQDFFDNFEREDYLIVLQSFNVGRFDNLLNCKVDIIGLGEYNEKENMCCFHMEELDVLTSGGFKQGDEHYSSDGFDILLNGMSVRYNVTVEERDNEEEKLQVNLIWERVR